MLVTPFSRRSPEDLHKEYRALRTARFTYVRDLKGPWLLYDDIVDPYQMKNLVAVNEYKSILEELDSQLHDKLRVIGDDFRPGAWYIEEWGFKPGAHGSVPYANVPHVPQTPVRQK